MFALGSFSPHIDRSTERNNTSEIAILLCIDNCAPDTAVVEDHTVIDRARI